MVKEPWYLETSFSSCVRVVTGRKLSHAESRWIRLMPQGKERSSDESEEMSILINSGDVNTWVCVGLQGFGVNCPGFSPLPCPEWVFPDPLHGQSWWTWKSLWNREVGGAGGWPQLDLLRKDVQGGGAGNVLGSSFSVGARGFEVSSCRRSAPGVPGRIVSSKPWKLRGKSNPTLRSCLKTPFLKWELRVFSVLWGMGLSLPWVQVWLFY